MTRPIIAITDSPFPSLDPVKAAMSKLDPELRMSKSTSVDDILAVANDADAVIVCYAQITAALLGGLTRCKVIGRTGLGVDNIDVPAAAARGITVTYVPDYCLREVSDHAIALLLALARKITVSNKLVQSGRWELPPIVPLRRLEGQVLGLIGFGNIPRAVAPKAKAFGLNVITHDPFVSKDVLASAGVEGVSFDDLLGPLRFHLGACAAHAGDARPDQRCRVCQDEEGRVCHQHRAWPADRRAGADCGARFRPPRRRGARRGDDRAAGEGFQLSSAATT